MFHVVIAQPKPSPENDILAILMRLPASSVDSVAQLLQLPMLDEVLEAVALSQAGRLVRGYFIDYWDFAEWWARRGVSAN